MLNHFFFVTTFYVFKENCFKRIFSLSEIEIVRAAGVIDCNSTQLTSIKLIILEDIFKVICGLIRRIILTSNMKILSGL